jgi:hypothetical protein
MVDVVQSPFDAIVKELPLVDGVAENAKDIEALHRIRVEYATSYAQQMERLRSVTSEPTHLANIFAGFKTAAVSQLICDPINLPSHLAQAQIEADCEALQHRELSPIVEKGIGLDQAAVLRQLETLLARGGVGNSTARILRQGPQHLSGEQGDENLPQTSRWKR